MGTELQQWREHGPTSFGIPCIELLEGKNPTVRVKIPSRTEPYRIYCYPSMYDLPFPPSCSSGTLRNRQRHADPCCAT